MTSSIFLARAWGLYLTLISLALLWNKKALQGLLKIYKNETNVFLSGVVSLMMGIFTLSASDSWSHSWELIVLLFGWFALLKGVARTFFSGWVVKNSGRWVKILGNRNLVFLLLSATLVTGLYLSFIGFGYTFRAPGL